MGSTGSGNFGDYKPEKEPDKCYNNFQTNLEEIAEYDYFKTHKNVPPLHLPITIIATKSRIVAKETKTNLNLGALPTEYEYLRNCLKNKHKYIGFVIHSSMTKGIPEIVIQVNHQAQ